MNKDLVSSVMLMAAAAIYYAASTTIPASALSDEIGPRGLPTALAVLLAAVAAIIGARALLFSPAAAATDSGDEPEAKWPRALGLLAIGALYIPAAALLGYVPAIFLLILGVVLYERMRPSWRLVAIAAAGAGFFWLLFDVLLGVQQPSGILF